MSLLTAQAIESVAPDQASLSAASKIKRSAWATLGREEARGLAWGECQGSGATPYRISLDLKDLGAKCSCPSRKFPCKHALGLMLVALDQPQAFVPGDAPDWVSDWLSRRRPAAAGKPKEAAAEGAPRPTLDAVTEAPPAPRDEKAEARAAAQRERLKAQREDSVRLGLDELDRWIADQLDAGLASFPQRAPQQCRLAAQRLVDAKAPALATRLDALPAEILGLPEHERADRAIEVLGGLHLLAEAYRRQDRLPEPLRQDVRRLVGWTLERQELLDDATAPRLKAAWIVIAVHTEVQPDRLRRIETWLMTGDCEAPRFAVLIDFVPLASGQGGSAYVPGEGFDAELVYYPSAAPLRALLADRGPARPVAWPTGAQPLAAALDGCDALAAACPWLPAWPILVRDVALARPEGGSPWFVGGTEAVPIAPGQRDDVLALGTAEVSRLVGLWDGHAVTALAGETSLGRWHRA